MGVVGGGGGVVIGGGLGLGWQAATGEDDARFAWEAVVAAF